MAKNKKKLKVCFVLNIAPLYREGVFNKLDNDKRIDYYFLMGESSPEISAYCDMTKISGFKGYLKNIFSRNKLIFQRGWYKALSMKYDALILTGNPGIRSNWLLVVLGHLMGKKIYLWSHGIYGSEKPFQRAKNYLYMRLAGRMFLYGNYAKNKLKKMGYPPKNISVIYNSLNQSIQMKYRDIVPNKLFLRNYFGNDDPVVMFIGRLTPQKELERLIEALGVLKAQKIGCNAILLGDGEYKTILEARCKEVGVEDQVWFYGECYDEEMIATVLASSIACISPGNVGLTAVHAMSYGVPVITHNNFSYQMPEFEVIRRGVTGDFFRYGDSISLADKMHTWIELMKDPEKKEYCKQACYKIVDIYYNPAYQSEVITGRILRDFHRI